MKEIIEALEELDNEMIRHNVEREASGTPPLKRARIRILGQMALLLNAEIASKMPLFSTQDVDALIQGEGFVTEKFRLALEKRVLQFDYHSTEIWIPPAATYIPIFSGGCVDSEILDPLSVLTSKAIKAPDKNRALVRDALKIFGDELADKIREFGGDPVFFKQRVKLKL